MNVDTGEIVRLQQILLMGEGKKLFTPVPDEFADEANQILGDMDHAFADMSKDTPLVNWAKQERSKRSSTIQKPNKNRRKMAKSSRKINRK